MVASNERSSIFEWYRVIIYMQTCTCMYIDVKIISRSNQKEEIL